LRTVLVVDDIKTDRELVGKVVTAAGHAVEYAEDGESAMAKARAIKPALVLLDVVMPRQDGFATCRQLKKDPETAAIPVIMVTSKSTDTDRFWAEKQGAADLIAKPFTPETLSAVLKKFL
jgi:twitching motility two-component system response regulator PilH